MKSVFFSLALACLFLNLQAQSSVSPSPIIFIYDASGSMWGKMEGQTKMEIAAKVLSQAVNNLSEDQSIGLVAYGHRKKGDCEDVEFLVELNNSSKSKINTAVKAIQPLGKTPLAHSANLVIDKLRKTKTKATVILVTDGIESCDGNICTVVQSAKKEGIDFRLHIIGFGLQPGEREQLECAAKAGDGKYFDAQDADGLGAVLEEATNTSVDEPAGNYSIYAVKNGKPVDAIVRASTFESNKVVDDIRTYRDTGVIYLPPGKYNLEVRPLEGTDVSGQTIVVEVKEGNPYHKTVSFDAAKIQVETMNNGAGWDATVKVMAQGTNRSISSTRTYGRQQEIELNPGIYDVKFQALRMEGLETFFEIKNVSIQAGEIKSLSHNFATGIARIGVNTGGTLVDAIVNFKEVNSGTSVAGARTYTSDSSNPKEFILNPGKYQVSIQTLGVHKGQKETFEVVIKQGETTEKIFSF